MQRPCVSGRLFAVGPPKPSHRELTDVEYRTPDRGPCSGRYGLPRSEQECSLIRGAAPGSHAAPLNGGAETCKPWDQGCDSFQRIRAMRYAPAALEGKKELGRPMKLEILRPRRRLLYALLAFAAALARPVLARDRHATARPREAWRRATSSAATGSCPFSVVRTRPGSRGTAGSPAHRRSRDGTPSRGAGRRV